MQDDILYRALFDQTNDAVFIIDLNGHYLQVNKTAARMLGYTPDELVGASFTTVIADDQIEDGIQVMRRVLKGEVILPFERIFKRQDGSIFPAEIHLQLVYNDDGQPVHIQNVARDITERKRFEERLHFQASLLENVSDAIISTDAEGNIQTWNAAAEELYGWEEEEVIGHPLSEIIKTTSYDDRKRDTVHHVKRRYLTRGYWSNEVVQERRDGTKIYVQSSLSVLHDADDKMIGTVTVNHNIDKQKQAQLGLQRYIDQMEALRHVDGEMSSTLELEKVLHLALNAAVSLSGAEAGFIILMDDDTDKQLVRGYGGYQAFIETNRLHYPRQGISARALRQKRAEWVEYVHDDPDYVADLPETQALMAFPLMSLDRIVGLINLETSQVDTFTEDIFQFISLLTNRLATSLDNAQLYNKSQARLDELRVLYDQVSSLEQLKTDMIRMASHDLRNPVGLINGYTALLKDDLTGRISEEEMDFLVSISNAVERMQGIIDEILSLERIHQVAQDNIRELINLNELSNKIVMTHQAEAIGKDITMTLTRYTAMPPTALGDPAQLQEALSNLITNAIKYTPQGGDIRVSVHQEDSQVIVIVEDTGYGIQESQQSQLFQPFYRAKSDETASIKGVGLGLSLVKNIVERHQGHMIFESVYQQGSTFGFALPYVDELPAE